MLFQIRESASLLTLDYNFYHDITVWEKVED